MAKFSFFMAMLALLLVVSSGLDEELTEDIVPSGLLEGIDDEEWISPSPHDVHITPEEKFFEACVSVLSDNGCGNQIFSAIFEDNSVVDPLCCTRFIQIGEGCAEVMIKSALQFPDYKDMDTEKAFEKSLEVYDNCVNLVGDGLTLVPSSSP